MLAHTHLTKVHGWSKEARSKVSFPKRLDVSLYCEKALFCIRKKVPLKKLKFMFDGEDLDPNATD